MKRASWWGSLLLCSWVLVLAGSAHGDEGFRVIHEEHGIVVSVRDEPGRALPVFRGTATVEAPVLHVLSVILDDARVPEWAKDADEGKVLRTIDARTHIVYSRSRQPWPVRDRDLVMKRKVEVVRAHEAYRVELTCVPSDTAVPAGVIRIRDCQTVFALRDAGGGRTHVDYRVRVDPGGPSPAWLVRAAAKSTPLDTLEGLRRQVAKTRGQYDADMRLWAQR